MSCWCHFTISLWLWISFSFSILCPEQVLEILVATFNFLFSSLDSSVWFRVKLKPLPTWLVLKTFCRRCLYFMSCSYRPSVMNYPECRTCSGLLDRLMSFWVSMLPLKCYPLNTLKVLLWFSYILNKTQCKIAVCIIDVGCAKYARKYHSLGYDRLVRVMSCYSCWGV